MSNVQINTINTRRTNMFITIGFIVGFIAGWWVNEKVENLGEKINPLRWFKK